RALPRPTVLRRPAAGGGSEAARHERAGVRVLPARRRAHRTALCRTPARATALVRSAPFVGPANGVEYGVLLPLVGYVSGVVAVVGVQPGEDDAHVRRHARADRGEPVFRAVAGPA